MLITRQIVKLTLHFVNAQSYNRKRSILSSLRLNRDQKNEVALAFPKTSDGGSDKGEITTTSPILAYFSGRCQESKLSN